MSTLRFLKASALALAVTAALPAAAATFVPPLEQPAMASPLAAHTPLMAVTTAGKRLVAVGQRGHIVFSDDGGKTWTQASVPVSTGLVAVAFPTDQQGWAVGHGGVVLHTADGGTTWEKQLDGKQSSALAIRYLEAQVATNPAAERLAAREKGLVSDGGTQPLLGVYFENATTGFVVGTFNRIFRTDDGGKTWTPWMDRTENADEFHFNAIAGGPGGIYLAGEQGMVWRLDAGQQRFVKHPTPYQGSFFGILSDGADTVLAFGLRGNVYRSGDAGKTWEKIPIGSSAGITSGIAVPGSMLLTSQAGAIVRSVNGGKTFAPIKPAQPMAYYGIAPAAQGAIVLAGSEGVRLEADH